MAESGPLFTNAEKKKGGSGRNMYILLRVMVNRIPNVSNEMPDKKPFDTNR